MIRIPKKDRVFVLVLVAAAAVAVGVELLVPTPLDWRETFERDDTRPYGSLVLFELLPDLFPDAPVEAVEVPPYLALRDTAHAGLNYLFVTTRFAPDPAETEKLLGFVARGHSVFVAARAVEGALADTLRLWVDHVFAPEADSLRLGFTSASLRGETYAYGSASGGTYFHLTRASTADVLGTDAEGRPVYVRVPWGRGALYLHAAPQAFTNYYLLAEGRAEYVYKALSHLPVRPVWWDAHYKPLRQEATTPLRFVLADPALRMAWYVLLATAALFVLFEAKRRQRPIPVQKPPRNDTAAFIETLGRLYHQRGDHAHLARKRVAHFLDHLRTRLNTNADALDEATAQQTARRSGVALEDVQMLFAEIEQARRRDPLPETDLHALSTRLEDFYQQSRR